MKNEELLNFNHLFFMLRDFPMEEYGFFLWRFVVFALSLHRKQEVKPLIFYRYEKIPHLNDDGCDSNAVIHRYLLRNGRGYRRYPLGNLGGQYVGDFLLE